MRIKWASRLPELREMFPQSLGFIPKEFVNEYHGNDSLGFSFCGWWETIPPLAITPSWLRPYLDILKKISNLTYIKASIRRMTTGLEKTAIIKNLTISFNKAKKTRHYFENLTIQNHTNRTRTEALLYLLHLFEWKATTVQHMKLLLPQPKHSILLLDVISHQ